MYFYHDYPMYDDELVISNMGPYGWVPSGPYPPAPAPAPALPPSMMGFGGASPSPQARAATPVEALRRAFAAGLFRDPRHIPARSLFFSKI